ncbi:hypothetical protein [Actinomycetia phage DSL-LC01]|nr:hypothetical protein [Actinomycetia phage DSL-LC01]
MTLPNYTIIYNRVFDSLWNDVRHRGVPVEEVQRTANSVTASLWSLYAFVEKDRLPETANAVVDSMLEMFQ